MPSYFRQATASQSRTLGPFISDTDFKTPVTNLTIAASDVKIIVNGGASADKNSGGGTHRANGMYGFTFDATDTAVVGEHEISVKVAGALEVFKTFWNYEEVVYDAIPAPSAPGYLQPTTDGRKLDVSAAGNAGIDWSNIEAPTTAVNLSATNIDVDQIVASVSGNVVGSIGSLATQAKADVNAEVVDAINVDTYSEPTGVPPATSTLVQKIGRLYMVMRNELTVTATKKQFLNDAGVAAWEKDLSDDGTTYSESEGNAP